MHGLDSVCRYHTFLGLNPLGLKLGKWGMGTNPRLNVIHTKYIFLKSPQHLLSIIPGFKMSFNQNQTHK